jgi:hypothetical protein
VDFWIHLVFNLILADNGFCFLKIFKGIGGFQDYGFGFWHSSNIGCFGFWIFFFWHSSDNGGLQV